MAKKVDEITKLSEEMLRVLESRRDLGGDAYPTTPRRLAEFCGGSFADDQILKAVGKKAFTARAVATEKVGGKPSLDSPVYFKEDVPRVDPVKDLSTRMLLVLEAQRRLGGAAYPPSLRRLAELCERKASDKLVPKAASHEVLSEKAVVTAKAGKQPNLDAPVVMKEDLETGASAVLPALLRFALRPATSTVKKKKVETHAFPAADLAKRFIDDLRGPFEDALSRGIEREDLPADVAWVAVKGAPLLFLAENLRPGGARRALPAGNGQAASPPPSPSNVAPSIAPARPEGDFAEAFRAAFERLDRRNGSTNFVKLSELRQALAGFGREAFDAGLRTLRIDGLFSLDSHEGIHGSLTPEEREAGVSEAGSLLIYASRR